jgi:hypothetical protein
MDARRSILVAILYCTFNLDRGSHPLIHYSSFNVQMKLRAESLDGDLDALKAAFSEISRLSAEVATERPTTPSARSVQAGRKGRSSPTPATP